MRNALLQTPKGVAVYSNPFRVLPRRKVCAALAVVSILALSAAVSASAQTVVRSTRTTTVSTSFPAGTLCPFAVEVSSDYVIDQTFFYDDAGVLVKKFYVVNDSDTWNANGKSLTGNEIFHERFLYEGGVLEEFIVTGLGSNVGKILLGPDGGVFMGSGVGRTVLDGSFQLVSFAGLPLVAVPADPAAFCAALT
jgi:hypothetical protein